jgi:hypothetical protein
MEKYYLCTTRPKPPYDDQWELQRIAVEVVPEEQI